MAKMRYVVPPPDGAKDRRRRPGDGLGRVPATPTPTVSPITAKLLRAPRRNQVGPAQEAVMAQLVAWIDASGGRGTMAIRLGRTEGVLTKYLTCAVVFSEATASRWADDLKLKADKRTALLDLAAIATMTQRQLDLLGFSEAKVMWLGQMLRG